MTAKYYKTKASVQEYIKLAKDVNGADLIEQLKTFLAPNADLLEIGTGPGTDWNILQRNFKVIGSDNSLEFLKHLHITYPSASFLELDAITLDTDKKFDGLYSNKVMHHLKDQEIIRSIKRQQEVLKVDGIICHSFWKGDGSEIFKGLFVNYHSEASLKLLFEPSFEILLLESYKEFETGDSLLLIGKKKVDIKKKAK